MRHLAAFADLAGFDFDERADLRVLREARARAQVRVRPDRRVLTDVRVIERAEQNARAVVDARARDARARADLAAIADPGVAVEERRRMDDGVCAHAHGGVDVRQVGVEDRDAFRHELHVGSLPQKLRDVRELRAVVHAEDLGAVWGLFGENLLAFLFQDRDHIGQVELFLLVRFVDLGERRAEGCSVEDVDAPVDLLDRAFGTRGVRLFHDALDVGLRADDATVAGRVLEPCGEDRGGGLLRAVVRDQAPQRLCGDEWRVAGNDDDVAAEIAERFVAGARGVCGTELLLLPGGEERGLGEGLRSFLDLIAVASDDEDGLLRLNASDRVEDRSDQRATAEVVEDLRLLGPEALALAGRHHDSGERAGFGFRHQDARAVT